MIRVLVVLMTVMPVVASAQAPFVASAQAPFVAPAQAPFQLPSGNIHCQVSEGELICAVLSFTYVSPPRPPNCNANWGNVVRLGSKGPARLICYGDPGDISGDPVLRYGQAWQGPGMSCTAAQTGLRCVNGEGRGFEMSRARVRVF